jgi:hypothetical protein
MAMPFTSPTLRRCDDLTFFAMNASASGFDSCERDPGTEGVLITRSEIEGWGFLPLDLIGLVVGVWVFETGRGSHAKSLSGTILEGSGGWGARARPGGFCQNTMPTAT